MRVFPILFLPLLATACRDLTGEWKNSKGSILKIEQRGHHLHGTFRTAVEVSKGSAGHKVAHVRGFVEDGMMSFAVKYPNSMAAFTGQCYPNSLKETIHVSWILHTKQETCDDNWLASRFGQEKFVRTHAIFSNELERS